MIGIIVYLFFSFWEKKEKGKKLENIPSFRLETVDGNLFTSKNLMEESMKVIIYFSPDCHFCQAEAEELSKTYFNYKNIQWIWIASEPISTIKEFAQKYKLNKQNNIFWCHDEMARFYRQSEIKSVPYFLVYDTNNHLLKRNSGAIKVEKLLKNTDEKN
ncbi:hypothetical protein KCF3NO3_03550 [Chryseobacterium sp. KCF3-3]